MIERCPVPQEDCPYFNMKPRKVLKQQGETTGCYSDTDHIYHPARNYRTPLEQEFRELPENKRQMCRWLHDLRHLEEKAPAKPDAVFMVQALSKVLEEHHV